MGSDYAIRDIFASAKSVFRRANHHITNLEAEINFFTADKPYSYTVDDNSDGSRTHHFLFNVSFSDDIACVMFDAINNLRSSLDQMAYAIAIRHRGPSKHYAYFPFCKDFAFWKDRINGAKDDFPSEVIAVFERFKPYKRGNNPLWAINYMANIKKHAILIPVGFGRTLTWDDTSGVIPGNWDVKKNEITFRTINADSQSQLNFTYTIAIRDEEEIIDGQPPVALLNAMSAEVGRVLTDTEAECQRVGFIP